jgi:major vault protein
MMAQFLIGVWAGYAIMVVGKSGERKVIVGPSTYLLEFDEDMQVFSLSKGNPKIG